MRQEHTVVAKLIFLTASEGGRARPPAGARYGTVARFPAQSEEWSLVCDFLSEPVAGEAVMARVRFLAPDPPKGLLVNGTGFELTEGPKVVASGEVISVSAGIVEEAAGSNV